jgi:hypothetical protein
LTSQIGGAPKSRPVFSIEVRDAFVAAAHGGRARIDFLAQHQPASLMQTEMLLELQRTQSW